MSIFVECKKYFMLLSWIVHIPHEIKTTPSCESIADPHPGES